ncbi:HK97 family phage prohead protease [Mycobacterium marinum]|uniref:HK97 family phage prohead protease n=1 Tax=Mycobacterium marinum TaxID=1781 RepID=UPI000B977BA1|nr:HK97 family phage prohead protease [Mycobacterium marinum]
MTVTDERPIEQPPQFPVELRAAAVDDVDYAERIITVIAAPYEQEALVSYRQELWKEVFTRGAFDSIIDRPNRIRANRDHNKTRTVGKIAQFMRGRSDGLVADVKIAKTDLGDETLALAADDCLSASVGFAVRPSDESLDRRNRIRRVNVAILDHLAFVEDPAYAGAEVLGVRGADFTNAAGLPPLPQTPNLDQEIAELAALSEWSKARLNKQ